MVVLQVLKLLLPENFIIINLKVHFNYNKGLNA